MYCKLILAFSIGIWVGKRLPTKERTDNYLSRVSRKVGRVIAQETLDELLPPDNMPGRRYSENTNTYQTNQGQKPRDG